MLHRTMLAGLATVVAVLLAPGVALADGHHHHHGHHGCGYSGDGLDWCVPTPPPPPVVTEGPNADAFCYGTGANSYEWITPAEFAFLTTAPQPELGGKPEWSYGTIANATKGTDASGVMGNGFTPTCAKGTPTGQYVDNQGWWEVPGLPTFAGIVNPQGGLTVPEHYQVVTVP